MSSHSEPANVVLIGFMGAGKSTVARELERLSGFRLIDLDALIVEQAGRTIEQIFADEGEGHFRDLETAALHSLAGVHGMVIATGGGIVGREANWQIMRQLGLVVYLRASWATLNQRLHGSQGRPLVDAGQQRQQVEALWRRRLPLYEQADLCIDTDALSVTEVAQMILRCIDNKQGEANV